MDIKKMKIRFLIMFIGFIIGKLTSFIDIHPLFIDAISYVHFNHIYKKYNAFFEYPILFLVGFSIGRLF